uniref:Uncharacterized protein n=1 Tax=Leersia perrieri TaxID=77586 RepID=A0A0D9VPC3_9ORYZ
MAVFTYSSRGPADLQRINLPRDLYFCSALHIIGRRSEPRVATGRRSGDRRSLASASAIGRFVSIAQSEGADRRLLLLLPRGVVGGRRRGTGSLDDFGDRRGFRLAVSYI